MTILHRFGETLRQALGTIPLEFVRVLFVASLVLLLIWILRLPRERVVPENGTGRWDENLKLGASLAIGIQILVYLIM